jgi:HEAT repeat protein
MSSRVSYSAFAGLLLLLLAAALGAAPAAAQETDVLLRDLQTIGDIAKREDILWTLGDRSGEAVRLALESVAADKQAAPQLRMQAVCSLRSSATGDTVPLLLDIVETDLAERHGYWACAIPLLGQLEERRAIPLLMQVANLDEEQLIGMDHMAIEALARIGDERELGFFMAKADIPAIRPTVIGKLAEMAAPQSVDILIGALSGAEEAEVVQAAENGLLKIGEPAIEALIQAGEETEGDPVLRKRATAVLDQIRSR